MELGFGYSALLCLRVGFLGAAVGGAVAIPILGDALKSITEDLVDRGAVDWGDVAKDATWGAVFGPLAKKVGNLFPDGASQYICLVATFCIIIMCCTCQERFSVLWVYNGYGYTGNL